VHINESIRAIAVDCSSRSAYDGGRSLDDAARRQLLYSNVFPQPES